MSIAWRAFIITVISFEHCEDGKKQTLALACSVTFTMKKKKFTLPEFLKEKKNQSSSMSNIFLPKGYWLEHWLHDGWVIFLRPPITNC